MVDPIASDERLISLPGRGVGAASEEVVRAAEKRGYTVGATGPGTFRLVKTYRPTWAIVAAVVFAPFLGLGLFFLLVRRSEAGVISVFEDRDGAKARIVGEVDSEIVQHLSQTPQSQVAVAARPNPSAGQVPPLSAASGDAMPAPVGQPVSSVPPIPAHSAGTAPTSAPIPSDAPPVSPASPANAPVPIPSSPLTSTPQSPPSAPIPTTAPPIRQKPAASASAPSTFAVDSILGTSTVSGEPLNPDLIRTVSRPRRWTAGKSEASVIMPDGQEMPVGAGLVVGRSPDAGGDNSAMRAFAFAEPSLSKTHLLITPWATGVLVTDLHSTNGTSIRVGANTTPCPPGVASDAPSGSEIVAGEAVIRVRAAT